MVRGLAIASVNDCKSKALAQDYALIEEGDHVIACNNDGIRWKALIDEVVVATDDEEESPIKGETIKIIKGKLVSRGSRSIAATVKTMRDSEIELPALFNPRGSGFKQGALAKLLTEEQLEVLESNLD